MVSFGRVSFGLQKFGRVFFWSDRVCRSLLGPTFGLACLGCPVVGLPFSFFGNGATPESSSSQQATNFGQKESEGQYFTSPTGLHRVKQHGSMSVNPPPQ